MPPYSHAQYSLRYVLLPSKVSNKEWTSAETFGLELPHITFCRAASTEPLGATVQLQQGWKQGSNHFFSKQLLMPGLQDAWVSIDEQYRGIRMFSSVCYWTIRKWAPSAAIIWKSIAGLDTLGTLKVFWCLWKFRGWVENWSIINFGWNNPLKLHWPFPCVITGHSLWMNLKRDSSKPGLSITLWPKRCYDLLQMMLTNLSKLAVQWWLRWVFYTQWRQ